MAAALLPYCLLSFASSSRKKILAIIYSSFWRYQDWKLIDYYHHCRVVPPDFPFFISTYDFSSYSTSFRFFPFLLFLLILFIVLGLLLSILLLRPSFPYYSVAQDPLSLQKKKND
jgi:hypothetical protein